MSIYKKKNRREEILLSNQEDELVLEDDELFRISTSLQTFKDLMNKWFAQPLGVFEEYHILYELVSIAAHENSNKPINLSSFFEEHNFHIKGRIMYITADLLEAGECNVLYRKHNKVINKIELRRTSNNHSAPFPVYLGRRFGFYKEGKFIEIMYVRDST